MLMNSISSCENETQTWRLKFNGTAKDYNLYVGGRWGADARDYGLVRHKGAWGWEDLANQGRMLVGKTASKLQESGLNPGAPVEPMRSVGAAEQYSYLDGANMPQGPISRAQLEELFHAGKISADTNASKTGGSGWVWCGALGA